MEPAFGSYFLILIVALTGTYLLGFGLLWASRLLPSRKHALVFSCLLTGMTAVATITALATTAFDTVFLIVPVLAGLLVFQLKKKPDSIFNPIPLKAHLINLAELSLAGLAVFGFRYWFGYGEHGQPAIHDDLIFYAKLSAYLLKTGVETSNIEYIFTEQNRELPYHYFDLWLHAGFLKIFNVASVPLLYLVTYTLAGIAIWTGFCALAERKFNLNLFFKFLLLLCLLLTGLDFPELRMSLFDYYFYLPFNPVFYPKLFPTYLILIAWLLVYRHHETAAFLILLFLPVFSIITAPGILGGVMVYALVRFLSGERKKALMLAGFCLLIGTFFLLFYSVLHPAASSPYSAHFSDQVSTFLSFPALQKGGLLLVKTLLQLLLMFGIFAGVSVFFIGFRKLGMALQSWQFLAVACIAVAALLSWTVLEGMVDSRQFFTNLGVPLLNLGLLLLFISACNNSGKKFIPAMLVMAYLGFLLAETRKYMNISPLHSKEYVQEVSRQLAGLNPIGAYFKPTEEYTLVYTKSSNIFPKGTYLAHFKETQYFHTVNLSVFEIPVTPENAALENQLIQNTSFFKFVQQQKTAGTFRNLPESQLAFMERYQTDYLLVSNGYVLPENIRQQFRLAAKDPLSGEELYLRNPATGSNQ